MTVVEIVGLCLTVFSTIATLYFGIASRKKAIDSRQDEDIPDTANGKSDSRIKILFYISILFLFLGIVLLILSLSGVIRIGKPKTLVTTEAFLNNDLQDEATLRVKNRTKGDTEWQYSVKAEQGDRLAFDVYYHNTTEGVTAKNLRVRIDFVENMGRVLTFRAFLNADNSDYVEGTVNIEVPRSGLTFYFDNNATLYPNQKIDEPQTFPCEFLQPNSILINIGDIPGGWYSQGHVVYEGSISN